MKILNLFLIFIQFALCYGVDDLLEDPADLPNNKLTRSLPQIEDLNANVIKDMEALSTDVLDKIKHDDNMRDFVIIENLNLRKSSKLWQQYDQFSRVLNFLKAKLNFINEESVKHSYTELAEGSNPIYYEDSKDRNIKMQNIVINAMNEISAYFELNDIAQKQRQHRGRGGRRNVQGVHGQEGQEQVVLGQEGYGHGASGSGGYVPGYGQGSYGHGGYVPVGYEGPSGSGGYGIGGEEGYGHLSKVSGGVDGHGRKRKVQQEGQGHGQRGRGQGRHGKGGQ